MGKFTRTVLHILTVLFIVWLVDTFFLVLFGIPRYSTDKYYQMSFLLLIFTMLLEIHENQIDLEEIKENGIEKNE